MSPTVLCCSFQHITFDSSVYTLSSFHDQLFLDYLCLISNISSELTKRLTRYLWSGLSNHFSVTDEIIIDSKLHKLKKNLWARSKFLTNNVYYSPVKNDLQHYCAIWKRTVQAFVNCLFFVNSSPFFAFRLISIPNIIQATFFWIETKILPNFTLSIC